MENIIPRWEWRTFGEYFGKAEELIKQHQAKVRESSEIYILSAESNDNTKVRDMLMDIKYLVQVNEDKLEQWNPLMKGTFPLTVENLMDVLKSWKVEIQAEKMKVLEYEEFINDVVKVHPKLRAVDVFKERHGYKINDCIVEIANLKFNGSPIRTIAVEQEDPAKVLETVKMLELSAFENINYLRALKQFSGLKY